jgi:hypothetical protein
MSASGNPYAPQALVQLPQGRLSINIEEADGTYRMPYQNSLNLRFTKLLFRQADRRLEIGTEIRNVLQDEGFESVVTRNFFTATFGQASSWVEPRRMVFLARYYF